MRFIRLGGINHGGGVEMEIIGLHELSDTVVFFHFIVGDWEINLRANMCMKYGTQKEKSTFFSI
jgi:hypothetical protein